MGQNLTEATLEDRLRARLKPDAPPAGEKGEQVGKARMEEDSGDFADVMRRAVEMAAEHIGRDRLSECHKTVKGIVIDLSGGPRDGGKFGVGIGADGEVEFTTGGIDGSGVLTIRTSRATFHDMAYNRVNPGIAYAKGDVKLDGIPLLRLRGMDSLITSIFRGYRAASEGLDFDDVAAVPEGGALDEMLGMTLNAFDALLKALDRALGVFGVKYFYEKSLNRIEWLWEALDREVRRMLVFGREADEAGGSRKRERPGKPSPAVSLRDRLRERITAVVETAVAEVSRMAVSGYLVKRLIVPGSFRNFEDGGEVRGFEVRLKNKLGVATVIGFADVRVDGEVFGLDRIEIIKSGKTFPASDISDRRPLSVSFGDEMLIRVTRPGGIAPGRHRLELGVDMVGLGGVDVDYEEKLSA